MLYLFRPSVILALLDYVQVILFAIGMVYLIKYAKRNSTKTALLLVIIGTCIATLAGISKASWKLIFAITGNSVDILNKCTYVWLSNRNGFHIRIYDYLARKTKQKSSKTAH